MQQTDPIYLLATALRARSAAILEHVGKLEAQRSSEILTDQNVTTARRHASEILNAIDEYEGVGSAVSSTPTADEHQLDIEDGVASFEAYRAKREAQ